MSLWGNSDNVTSRGTVTLDYSTKIVTGNAGGSGTQFGTVGAAKTGDVIRFGTRGGTYYGDAVITGITSARTLTIGSTEGLSGAAIAAKDFYVSELPSYSVGDSSYSETNTGYDKIIYAVPTTTEYYESTGVFRTNGAGWVGVTTYVDCHGTLRVKSEVLVANGGSAGITTGANGIAYPTNDG